MWSLKRKVLEITWMMMPFFVFNGECSELHSSPHRSSDLYCANAFRLQQNVCVCVCTCTKALCNGSWMRWDGKADRPFYFWWQSSAFCTICNMCKSWWCGNVRWLLPTHYTFNSNILRVMHAVLLNRNHLSINQAKISYDLSIKNYVNCDFTLKANIWDH